MTGFKKAGSPQGEARAVTMEEISAEQAGDRDPHGKAAVLTLNQSHCAKSGDYEQQLLRARELSTERRLLEATLLPLPPRLTRPMPLVPETGAEPSVVFMSFCFRVSIVWEASSWTRLSRTPTLQEWLSSHLSLMVRP